MGSIVVTALPQDLEIGSSVPRPLTHHKMEYEVPNSGFTVFTDIYSSKIGKFMVVNSNFLLFYGCEISKNSAEKQQTNR